MSTSDLYSVYKTRTKHLVELPNGHGTGPVIWGYLCKQYLGLDSNAWLFGDNKNLWNLVDDKNIPRDIRLVHAFTYNDALCPKENLSEMAEACLYVYKITNDPSRVNHWESIGNFLKTAKIHPRSRGVALSCTSVNDPWLSWSSTVKINGDKTWNIFSEITA